MSKIILSINAGSSSVKISVYSVLQGWEPMELAEMQIDDLTAPPPKLKYSRGRKTIIERNEIDMTISTQVDAFKYMLNELISDRNFEEISTKEDILIGCHRVVHGGDFDRPKVITGDTYSQLEAIADLAPLHNLPALEIVQFCVKELPKTRNVAVFDSAFHQSLPKHIRTYPINQEIAKKNKLRKYGFHGISYSFITRTVAQFLGKREDETSLIILHLGSGASACAVKDGKSWDTSMGLTPLAGLPGATRSGSLDPSLVFHYATNVGNAALPLHITRAEEILNKESGWKSLTGTTSFADISSSNEPNKKLAFDIFVNRILGYLGSYYVSLNGRVDALVFAGGIGGQSDKLRQRVTEEASCLGFTIDAELNKKLVDEVQDVGRKGAKHKTLVCKTNEQFEMARYCAMDTEIFNI